MFCRFICRHLPQYLDGDLNRLMSDLVGRHLKRCPKCKVALAELKSIRDRLRSQGQETLGDTVPDEVVQTSMARAADLLPEDMGARERLAASCLSQAKPAGNRPGRRVMVLATAVLLLLVTPAVIHRRLLPNKVEYVKPVWAVDVTDDRKLVGLSDNVFIGKVVARSGSRSLSRWPETQFTVSVIENIKGNLSDNVAVNQFGGDRWFGVTVLFEGDSLIVPGKAYLFATRYNDVENWHTLTPIYGRLEISDERDLETLRSRFLRAYAEQIEYKP